MRRAIYRLAHYPRTEHAQLVVLWLWSDREGVFSHETSFALHDLSDTLPARVHMTLPVAWRLRRMRTPDGLVLHYASLQDSDITWFDAVHVTRPQQVIAECIDARVRAEWVEQALHEATERGLLSKRAASRLSQRLEQASQDSP